MRSLLLFFIPLALFAQFAVAQRVVSLVPSATFAAMQFGADANIVGRTSYCPKPSSGVVSQVVGDVMTVSVETIVALRPDAVIASPFTQKAVVDRLKSLKIKVVLLPTPKSFREICDQNLEVGRLTGHEAQAASVNRAQSLAVDSISKSASPIKNAKTYVQIGTRPTWGATPDYYINDILVHLGLTNILNVGDGGCSREVVMLRKPDVVVVSSMGGLGNDELLLWQKSTNAKTVLIDESVLGCPTPTFFRQALEQLCNALRL